MYYSQLDIDNVVIAISRLSGKVNSPNMIELPEYDTSLIGKRYNAETEQFEAIE
jgi:hypothetical protein